ncbi:MAG: DUF4091 domain-containing protein [Victivallales bacterium]|nr:DUF4091 domain-containing protein [Victivallales bacterium]
MKRVFPVFLLLCVPLAWAGGQWGVPECEFRLDITAETTAAAWAALPLSPSELAAQAGKVAGVPFREESISCARCALFLLDGETEHPLPDSGWFLRDSSPELVPPGLAFPLAAGDGSGANESNGVVSTPNGQQVRVSVQGGRLYLCRFSSSGGGSAPTYLYEPVFEEGSRLRKFNWASSFIPRLLPQEHQTHRVLLRPDRDGEALLFCSGRFMGQLHALSLKETQLLLMVRLPAKGSHRLRLYFQPVNSGVYLSCPQRDFPMETPMVTARVHGLAAERRLPTRWGMLAETEFASVHSASPMQKLTPGARLPSRRVEKVRLSVAGRERESFQVVLAPKRNFRVRECRARLVCGQSVIPPESLQVREVRYVPIRRAERTSPWRFQGLLGDALAEFRGCDAKPDRGNLALWCTLCPPPGTATGVYTGELVIATDRAGDFRLPLEVRVRSFSLPERPFFRTNLGLQYFAKGAFPVAAYHGVSTPDDLRRLSNLYFESLADNRLSPKNVALYTPLTFQWDPPPQGMGVDAPGNHFRLHSWDFTEYNRQLRHFLGERGMAQLCIYHTNPTACNVFAQLPGRPMKERFNTASPFVTMQNQATREMCLVAYGLDEKHSYAKLAQTITRAQFDHLLLDYLRAIAGNLREQGYLDRATILIDEGSNDEFLLHFLSLLKNDPLLRQVKVGACLQSTGYYTRKAPDGSWLFRDLLDTYIPQMDETYDRLEPYYRSDYGLAKGRGTFMPYLAYSSRLSIDVPGLTNRIIGWDVFRRGGCGLLDWEILTWNTSGKPSGSWSPWEEPDGYGNGGTAYFYPPTRRLFQNGPDFTVTPSLRLELLRDASEDFDYAMLLEEVALKARASGTPDLRAEALLSRLESLFDGTVAWTIQPEALETLREEIADELERYHGEAAK